jgi:hypothetical protein
MHTYKRTHRKSILTIQPLIFKKSLLKNLDLYLRHKEINIKKATRWQNMVEIGSVFNSSKSLWIALAETSFKALPLFSSESLVRKLLYLR